MVAPNTGSITTAESGRNRTGTAVSTNIIIEVDGNAIGAIQNLQVTESRSIVMIDEVGTDGHIDSVPNKSTDVSISCNRIRFDNLRVAAAFSRPYIHVHSQRIPFDIVIKDIFAGDDPASTLVTTIKNCWIEQIQYDMKASDFVIAESMSLKAETIYTTLGANSNAVPAATGGRNLPIGPGNVFELAADRGDRRGALDGAGLLLAIETA
jgi:hypothetical protein